MDSSQWLLIKQSYKQEPLEHSESSCDCVVKGRGSINPIQPLPLTTQSRDFGVFQRFLFVALFNN